MLHAAWATCTDTDGGQPVRSTLAVLDRHSGLYLAARVGLLVPNLRVLGSVTRGLPVRGLVRLCAESGWARARRATTSADRSLGSPASSLRKGPAKDHNADGQDDDHADDDHDRGA